MKLQDYNEFVNEKLNESRFQDSVESIEVVSNKAKTKLFNEEIPKLAELTATKNNVIIK